MYMGLLPLIYHQYHLIHHKLYSLENSDKTFFTKPLRNTLEKGGILERVLNNLEKGIHLL